MKKQLLFNLYTAHLRNAGEGKVVNVVNQDLELPYVYKLWKPSKKW